MFKDAQYRCTTVEFCGYIAQINGKMILFYKNIKILALWKLLKSPLRTVKVPLMAGILQHTTVFSINIVVLSSHTWHFSFRTTSLTRGLLFFFKFYVCSTEVPSRKNSTHISPVDSNIVILSQSAFTVFSQAKLVRNLPNNYLNSTNNK